MLPQSQPRKKRNSSKVNLMISFAFHALLVVGLLYFAARSGLLGTQLKKITVTMEKEKPPVKPPEPPKQPEPPKIVEPPKVVAAPPKEAEAAPKTTAPPVVAPPAAELPSFDFAGGKIVESSSDPVQIYRGYMEYVLRSKWDRPENMADDNYAAEVAVAVNPQGQISAPVWQKGSGDTKWDDSVKQVFKLVKNFDRPPPTNFPASVVIRFDVQSEATEPVLQ
jgi:TonB C terminal